MEDLGRISTSKRVQSEEDWYWNDPYHSIDGCVPRPGNSTRYHRTKRSTRPLHGINVSFVDDNLNKIQRTMDPGDSPGSNVHV